MLVEGQDGVDEDVEEDVKGKDWCSRRGCRTESRGGGGCSTDISV